MNHVGQGRFYFSVSEKKVKSGIVVKEIQETVLTSNGPVTTVSFYFEGKRQPVREVFISATDAREALLNAIVPEV